MQPQPWSQLRRPRQPVVQIRELSPCQRVVMALQQQQRARATRWPQQTWLNESVVGRSLPHTSSRYKGLARPRYTAQSTHHTMTFKQWLISDALLLEHHTCGPHEPLCCSLAHLSPERERAFLSVTSRKVNDTSAFTRALRIKTSCAVALTRHAYEQ
jgi:hypothetical protein